MKYLLLGACLVLTSCASQRQLTPARLPAEPISAMPAEGQAYTPDALTKPVEQPARRLFGLLPPKAPLSQVEEAGEGVPRKCKGCTFNVVSGDQHNNTAGKKAAAGDGATALNKPAGPTAVGDSATATDNTKAGQRGGAAATAPRATATATTQKSGWPWWAYVLLLGAGGFLIYRGYKSFTDI